LRLLLLEVLVAHRAGHDVGEKFEVFDAGYCVGCTLQGQTHSPLPSSDVYIPTSRY
jgi:hypothetical protein